MLKLTRRLFVLFLISLLLSLGVWRELLAQSASTWQQARNYYEQQQYQAAIAGFEHYLKTTQDSPNEMVEIYRYLGDAYAQVGRFPDAIETWEKAIQIYNTNNSPDQNRSKIELKIDSAQAHINLGQTKKAIDLLDETLKLTQSFKDLEASARGVLGNAYLNRGDLEKAFDSYSTSLKIARSLNSPTIVLAALNNLTTTSLRMANKYETDATGAQQENDGAESLRSSKLANQKRFAASYYAIAAVEASRNTDSLNAVRALLNAIPLIDEREALVYSTQAFSILKRQPASRTKVYSLINLAEIGKFDRQSLLELALSTASQIEDSRALSWAFGSLGELYEQKNDYRQALLMAQQAILKASEIFAYDSLYRWQWQLGRIYQQTQQTEQAIAAYENAVASLQKIREDIAIATKEFQLDFRDEVEPIYRNLLALLLEEDLPKRTQKALEIFDLLQLSQLESFFGDICLEVSSTISPQERLANTNSAAITSIILKDKTYLLLQMPDGSLHRYPIDIEAEQLNQKIEQWRWNLENSWNNQYREESQSLYELLIRPLESTLAAYHPKTLVFINDGILRNVPMAALHDGRQFLVEKYAIANSVGLKFTNEVISPDREALSFGLTVAKAPFKVPLPNVAPETKAVQQMLGGSRFLNEKFTARNFERQMENKDYSIIHLATHGKFAGSLENTFIQAFDRSIPLLELERLLNQRQSPIQLLAFSACQTAGGNDRAVLGLAGVSVRSGVRTALGTLWSVSDATIAESVEDFYRFWNSGLSLSEALRQAQLKQIPLNNSHPGNWGALVLIGNWQ
jgi:CHAT domain-containing protein/predicted negative regulator of RcsB-dependent stress response